MKRRFQIFRKKSARISAKKPARQFIFEQVEDRRMMSVSPTLTNRATNIPMQFAYPVSEGTITYDASSKNVTVTGSTTADQSISIYLDPANASLVDISISNSGLPITKKFSVASVAAIQVNGSNGKDFIDNRTGIEMIAYGNAGNDIILGGTGGDYLLGGDGEDYLDGRGGDDMIWGYAGNDVLFGDAGNDYLFGSDGYDILYGGNDTDHLYGEGGDDRLFGGAGIDILSDTDGANTMYTDYGPDNTVSASRFQSFDYFDRYLKDPTVRSLARLDMKDGVLNRSEMLSMYSTIEADGLVSANEFSDLKALVNTKINMSMYDRYFANKIVNGNYANAWYQGQALGNLAAGSTATHLLLLVDKWDLGADLPLLTGLDYNGSDPGTGTAPTYAYVSGSLFVDGPSITDIDQGFVGDCYFMSGLGEIAAHMPSVIDNMFIDNHDGTFGVEFFHNGSPEFVTVNHYLPIDGNYRAEFAGWGTYVAGSDTYGNLKDDATHNELWVALAEKAYVQLNESNWIGQDGTNRYAGIEVGLCGAAFSQVAGKTATNHGMSSAADLITAISQGHMLGISTKTSGVEPDIVDNHCYMVTGYDSITETFQLRNPWGSTGQYEGNDFKPLTLSLTWSQLVSNFSGWTSSSF